MHEARPRLLFVGHDASRTGAPVLGLTFLRWAVAHGVAHVTIALLGSGPLAREHARLAPTTVLPPRSRLRLGIEAARRGGARARRLAPPRPPADIVVANTLASLPSAAALDPARLICWVHELDGVADRLVPPPGRARLLDRVDHFVAAGDRVATMLTQRWLVDPARVTAVDPFTDPAPALPAPADESRPQVLGSGSLVPRKGADAFVSVVGALAASGSAATAAWVGGDPGSPFGAEVRADIEHAGLDDRLDLVAEVDDLDPWWPHHGLLVHVPREDPFPLVVLEAAARAIPTITWETGGAADLVTRAGLGHLVADPGDVLAVVRRARALLDDPTERAAAGRALAEVAADLTTERQAPRVWAACAGRTP